MRRGKARCPWGPVGQATSRPGEEDSNDTVRSQLGRVRDSPGPARDGRLGLPHAGPGQGPAHDPKADSPEHAAVRKVTAAFGKAFNQGDAKALAALWTKEGEYTGPDGERTRGREAIEKEYVQFFKENPKARIEGQVYGSVEPKTQRVAWSIGEKKDIVFEAGLSNLTQDQTTILAHYGKERTRQMTLVRLEEPQAGKP